MIKNLKELLEAAQKKAKATIVLAGAHEEEIAVAKLAIEANLAEFILIGNELKMRKIVKAQKVNETYLSYINQDNDKLAAQEAIALVKAKKADFPMKGLMHTSIFMRAVLDKNNGLATYKMMTQITVFDGYNDELQYLTDCAITIQPDLVAKKEIIENAVKVARQLGNPLPIVALLGSVETVNPKMLDTIDSAALTQMNRRGQIRDCLVDGPLALDNAISAEFAKAKGINSPVAGQGEILVAPDLAVANTLSKAITHYAKKDSASIIAGTSVPIVMTSRTDKAQNKLYAIAEACYLA